MKTCTYLNILQNLIKFCKKIVFERCGKENVLLPRTKESKVRFESTNFQPTKKANRTERLKDRKTEKTDRHRDKKIIIIKSFSTNKN
jgi:hypothetical protein